jgi:hypothetical protein
VIARKRAIVIPDIADATIDIREGCPLFLSVGNTADGRQGAVFYSYVGTACAIGSGWRGLGMGGLREYRTGDQEHCKHTEKDFHGRSLRGVETNVQHLMNAGSGSVLTDGAAIGSVL